MPIPNSLDITDLDLDVTVPETDFTKTQHAGRSETCLSWNHISRCENCY